MFVRSFAMMRSRFTALTMVGLLGTALMNGADGQQRETDNTPNFVFTGTVKKLEASNVPHVKDSNRTAIVSVDDVLSDLPKALSGVKGQEVTVELNKSLADAPLKVGQKLVFSTQGHVYGEKIAVREVGDRAEPPQANARVVPEASNAALRRQVTQAAAVVTGTVEEIRPVSTAKIMEAAGKAVGPVHVISEHDPDWHAAVIKVDTVEKGVPNQKRVVVLFPQSRDIAWRSAPKFTKDQKGTWMLQKQQIADATRRTHLMTAAANVADIEMTNVYTALNPKDFIPTHGSAGSNLEQIRAMIRAKP
jgi:hypothetical protein